MELQTRVIDFLSNEVGVRASDLSLETTLFGDLRLDGDDAAELLEKFGREFSVDLSQFHLSDHFGPEGVWPWTVIQWLAPAFRRGTPEERSRLKPITIADLVRSAELGKFSPAGARR